MLRVVPAMRRRLWRRAMGLHSPFGDRQRASGASRWHSAILPGVNTATVAALAAVLSFIGVVVNIVLTSRLSSRAQLEQWRRNEERPVVTRLLTLSEDALKQWWRAAEARRQWLDSLNAEHDRNGDTVAPPEPEPQDDWVAGSELYGKLRFEATQLELIAGQPLRDVANRLVRTHEGLNHSLRPASPRDNPISLVNEQNNKIIQMHEELIGKARADLGLISNI